MLPAGSRLSRRDEFTSVVRRGRRGGRSRLVVHLVIAKPSAAGARDAVPDGAGTAPRAGLIVGKGVGNAVVRHRVGRRLRHLVGSRLTDLPSGSLLVVRALAPAASATSVELGADLDAGLRAALGREVPR